MEKVVFRGWSLWRIGVNELEVDEGNFRSWRSWRKEAIDIVEVRDFRGWRSWRTEVMEEVFRDRRPWRIEVIEESLGGWRLRRVDFVEEEGHGERKSYGERFPRLEFMDKDIRTGERRGLWGLWVKDKRGCGGETSLRMEVMKKEDRR